MGIDAIVTLLGLIVPPGFDFIKKKFLSPANDTPEATMSSLATTNPETLPAYLSAVVDHLKAQIDYFNRDVLGTPSLWVINLRAAIRPITVIVGTLALIFSGIADMPELHEGTRWFFEGVVSSWFGSRLTREVS